MAPNVWSPPSSWPASTWVRWLDVGRACGGSASCSQAEISSAESCQDPVVNNTKMLFFSTSTQMRRCRHVSRTQFSPITLWKKEEHCGHTTNQENITVIEDHVFEYWWDIEVKKINHLISEDSVNSVLIQRDHPVEAADLIVTHLTTLHICFQTEQLLYIITQKCQ